MAKKSVIARNEQRKRKVAANFAERKNLRLVIKKTDDENKRDDALLMLHSRSRNASYIRIRMRCNSCGRSRGVMSKFGLCRICLREAFCRGDVPGLVKASW
jgi:small subunit ribosomal protein S14